MIKDKKLSIKTDSLIYNKISLNKKKFNFN